jgi:molybdenum-dependent DNA-binding transcriptional regulator ModE
MGPKVRKKILASLKRTGSVMETARALDLTYQAIYRAAKAVPGFGELVAELTAPRD